MIHRIALLASVLTLAACGSDEEPKSVVAPPPSFSQTDSYDCAGVGRVTALFTTEDKRSVQLGLPGGKTLTLQLLPSASGARYIDSANNEFWSKGKDAMLTTAGKTASCTQS